MKKKSMYLKSTLTTMILLALTHGQPAARADNGDLRMVHQSLGFRSPIRTFVNISGGEHHDSGYSLEQTADGGYIVAGSTHTAHIDGGGNSDAYLVKYDSDGDESWSISFGDPNGSDIAYSVHQVWDQDGTGYAVAGSTAGAGDGGGFLIRTSGTGEILWSRIYPGSCISSARPTTDGGFILAGDNGSSMPDIRLVKTDRLGFEQWTKTIDVLGSLDTLSGVEQTGDGGYVIAGSAFSLEGWGHWEMYLIKTDNHGQEEWREAYGGGSDDMANAMRITSDEGFILAGWSTSNPTYDVKPLIVRTDHAGNELWSRQMENPAGGGYYACDVQPTAGGGFIIAANYDPYDYWIPGHLTLIKTDAFGWPDWASTFNRAHDDVVHAVRQTMDHGFALTGYAASDHPGYGQILVVKTDSGGRVTIDDYQETSPLL